MKILITGASGVIGSYLMQFLWKQGYEVVGIVRNENAKREGFRYIVADIAKDVSVEEHFDIVIHCAAELDTKKNNLEQYITGNIFGTQNVLNYVRKHKIGKIINLNGVRSFGNVRDRVISESTPLYAPEGYGLTKFVAEKLLLDSDISVISLILPGVIGKNSQGPWLMRVSEDLIQGKMIDCYEPNAFFNNVIHINTVARVIHDFLNIDIKENQRILLGSTNYMTKYQIISFLKKGLESHSQINICNSNNISFYLDLTKAQKMNVKLCTIQEELSKLLVDLKEK